MSRGTQIQSITLQQSGGAPTNQIASVTSGSTVNYTYDTAGNVTNDGAHTYEYDSENRMVSVDGGSTASYAYDNQNRRYKKTIGSTITHYVWEGSHVLAEHNGSTGAVLIDYVYSGSRMIAKVASGVAQYFLNDRLSVRLSLDTSGNITGRQSHLPFGEDFGETGTQQKQHFTSYERDGEISTDYAVNRQYYQAAGRFMTADPYRASSYMTGPQSWNRYSYSVNDVANRKDPSGLDPFIGSSGLTSDNGRSNPCGSFGPSYAIDGLELSREMTCIFVFAGLIIREVINNILPNPTCADYTGPFNNFLNQGELAVAEAVFAESSGNALESVAIAYVILNRVWFLNVPNLTDTHGFGPKGASVRQVLGAGQFPEYDSTGHLQGKPKKRLENTLAGDPSTPDCQALFKAHATVYAITLRQFGDPYVAQGGSWYFNQNYYSGTPTSTICRDCGPGMLPGPLGPHWFYSFPFQNYTGGTRPPWL